MPRILFVDDLAGFRDIARAVLRELGLHQVDEAKDGQEALGLLTAMHYDLLISDWNMPIMDGLELLKAVRSNDALKSLPVIMLTGETARDKVQEAIALGVSGFVSKPFKPQALAKAVRRVIPEPA